MLSNRFTAIFLTESSGTIGDITSSLEAGSFAVRLDNDRGAAGGVGISPAIAGQQSASNRMDALRDFRMFLLP
ncbi:MAG: hypothetical protein QOC99_2865 [Acidobacteriota bacterium]|jgi:hypothetical protein|nr:hypothetical protein [Acidobacteriota bacterium]MDT7780353.1 hypothetical protein [Acidobacteriota bacterium]